MADELRQAAADAQFDRVIQEMRTNERTVSNKFDQVPTAVEALRAAPMATAAAAAAATGAASSISPSSPLGGKGGAAVATAGPAVSPTMAVGNSAGTCAVDVKGFGRPPARRPGEVEKPFIHWRFKFRVWAFAAISAMARVLDVGRGVHDGDFAR